VRLDPDNLHALSYLGKQQFADRRYTEAQQTWERVLQHDVTWAEGYFYLGAVLAERGERESALTAHQQALSRLIAAQEGLSEPQPYDSGDATDPSVTSTIALWDRELADRVPHEQALASFQEARHRLAQRYVTQGRESLQRDDAEGAIANLRWVNALDPADETARALLKQAQTSLTFERGLHHYQLQEYVEALRCFRETLALDPEHDKAKRYLRYAQQCLEGGLSERFRHLDLGEREKS
jgi:tetratricopeptide (TPR) repeat protein